jgi:conjugal transfer pilus assembly protein TrbC
MCSFIKQIALMLVLVIGYIPISFADTVQSNVIIFISFSMPAVSIKGWLNEANKIHAPVVIRGLVNNSFKDTLKRMQELTSDNQGGVQLDPTLFRRFQVKQVPAVVIRRLENCPANQPCPDHYDIVYGDTHLDAALEKIVKQQDELSSIAENLLLKLRERQHG